MLSSEEMVMDSAGNMAKLIEFIKKNGGGSSNVEFVSELPEAGKDYLNKLLIVAGVGEPATVTIFDAGGDKTKFITNEKSFDEPWTNYPSISIQGGNTDSGNLWDNVVVNNQYPGLEISITAAGGTENQGKYKLTNTGLVRTNNPYSHLGINKITGTTNGITAIIATCIEHNNSYVWIDLVKRLIIS